MSHEGFLRAIYDKPEDDAPRRSYADWLHEHGDADRAEFIRLQIKLAPLDLDDPRRPTLKDREVELMAAHRAEWLGDLLQIAAAECWWFRRGFPTGLEWETRRVNSGREISLQDNHLPEADAKSQQSS